MAFGAKYGIWGPNQPKNGLAVKKGRFFKVCDTDTAIHGGKKKYQNDVSLGLKCLGDYSEGF